MKNYALVLNLLLKNSFRSSRKRGFGTGDDRKKSRSSVARALVMTLATLPLAAIFGVLGYFSATTAASAGVEAEMLAILFATCQVITFFFGAAAVTSTVFMSADGEFLFSLPVSPSSVFFAKLTVVYINELTVTAVCLVPVCIGFGIASGATGAAAALFYLLIPVVIALLPMIPLFLISTLATPLMFLVSFLKKRSVMTTVVSITVTLAAMGAYFAFYSLIAESMTAETISLSETAIAAITKAGQVLYPFRAAAYAMLNVKPGANIGIFFGTVSAAFLLSAAIAFPSLKRGIAAQFESTGGSNSSAKELKTTSKSTVAALLIKDFKCLARYPSLAINSFLNIFVAPLILLLFLGLSDGNIIDAETASMMNVGLFKFSLVMFYCIMLSCGMNYVALLSFTREGKTFYINKYLPLERELILKEKSLFADIDSALGIVLVAIVSAFVMKANVLQLMFMVVCLIIYAKGFNIWGIYRDMKRPNFDWVNINDAVKRNFYAAVPMFVAMGVGSGVMVIGIIIATLSAGLSDTVQNVIFWAVNFVIALAILIGAKALMKKHGEELFYNMGEN